MVGELGAGQVHDPPETVPGRAELENLAPAVPEGEGHLGREMAATRTAASMWPNSVASARRNFRRAGMLKNRERTSICVPGASPQSRTSLIFPPSMRISVPARAPCSRVARRKRETLAMLGSASPRNPKVITLARSSLLFSLLVAWRSSESRASSRDMPQPSSITLINAAPPRSASTSTRFAPASRLFSTSSLITEAGRSMTSPAATCDARASDITWILPMGQPAPWAGRKSRILCSHRSPSVLGSPNTAPP